MLSISAVVFMFHVPIRSKAADGMKMNLFLQSALSIVYSMKMCAPFLCFFSNYSSCLLFISIFPYTWSCLLVTPFLLISYTILRFSLPDYRRSTPDTRCFENVIHGLPITAGHGDYSSPRIPYSAQCINQIIIALYYTFLKYSNI